MGRADVEKIIGLAPDARGARIRKAGVPLVGLDEIMHRRMMQFEAPFTPRGFLLPPFFQQMRGRNAISNCGGAV